MLMMWSCSKVILILTLMQYHNYWVYCGLIINQLLSFLSVLFFPLFVNHHSLLDLIKTTGRENNQEGDSGQLEHVCGQSGDQLRRRFNQETRRALTGWRRRNLVVLVTRHSLHGGFCYHGYPGLGTGWGKGIIAIQRLKTHSNYHHHFCVRESSVADAHISGLFHYYTKNPQKKWFIYIFGQYSTRTEN